jgi:glycine hydroxymethyltransferase
VNFSGKLFNVVSYGLHPDTHRLDYDQIRDLALKERPKLLIAGASAYPRVIDFEKMAAIAREIEAPFVVDMAHIAGLVASGIHPSPIPHATYTTTTTHKTLRGPRGGLILGAAERMKKVNSLIFPGIQGGPLMHVIAAKAVSFGEALEPSFRDYQKRIVQNAQALAAALMKRGLPLVTGGTDNHLMLCDLTTFGDGSVTGKDAEGWLDHAGITVNKNTVPGEKRSPFVTSGIRIGTPAVTTRGLGTAEMEHLAGWIIDALQSKGDAQRLESIRKNVRALCSKFPLYRA